MRLKKWVIMSKFAVIMSSCATLQNNAKYDLVEGVYRLKVDNKKFNCYVENNADSIKITNLASKISTNLPEQIRIFSPIKQRFIKSSLDIDILTTLLKIRPQVKQIIPAQLNTAFNGNLYIGHRTDVYQISYQQNPLNNYKRKVNHFGFSGGVFVGLGNTVMTPTTTNNSISTEYDGIILQKGLAGIIAVNKLTIGLSIGFDNLLDTNQDLWIYQNKPWFGLMLGLNLN
ncbi:hypothetical protein VB796_17710 [Arcicella sp. LKC2W]|uniref:hypothetical protein n=1 Tax=Arcicella sp. LKC2W TaxID=2984198 RepID=UPI002B21BAF0|nr:hypothetical protein [Arcicella sp. LKC2W]MEA5460901.1 hypothetical protein [Arcicella sp. LKC2W]